MTGDILFEEESIFGSRVDVTDLRQRIGMVFQKPNPFPMSIFENVAYGLRLAGERSMRVLQDRVEQALQRAALWDEVKDRLEAPAGILSGGQQQRLVIARAIAVEPEVLLLDEPASSLDPISTLRIEELIYELKSRYTIVVVTHNMQQAARVSDWAAFMHEGSIVEYDNTAALFTNPREARTEDYITGKFG
jgi:phosphate transport system ATP-binding protein